MFCAGCGSQIQSGLNYCSRCGRRVAEDAQASNAFWTNPLALTACTAGVGFIAFLIVVRILTRSAIPPNFIAPIAFVYFAALFGICFMMLRHGAAIAKHAIAPTHHTAADEVRPPAYLSPVTTAQLEEQREFGIGSVTDRTTRTLDKIERDRQ
jgi:hypothetical protein